MPRWTPDLDAIVSFNSTPPPPQPQLTSPHTAPTRRVRGMQHLLQQSALHQDCSAHRRQRHRYVHTTHIPHAATNTLNRVHLQSRRKPPLRLEEEERRHRRCNARQKDGHAQEACHPQNTHQSSQGRRQEGPEGKDACIR
jgi:hypothetical protein